MLLNLKNNILKYRPFFLRSAIAKIASSPIIYRIAKGTFWSLTGAIISRGLAFFSSIYIARFLGKECFGEFGIIHSTVGMFGVFAGFGIGQTATKYIAEFREISPERAGRIITLSGIFAISSGCFMALVLYMFAPFLALHTINAPQLSGILKISSLILLFSAFNGAQIGALSGFEAFKVIAGINIITGICSFLINIIFTQIAGLRGAVWALIINLIINLILNHRALFREISKFNIPLKFKGCKNEISILWNFSLPTALSGMMIGPVNWICNTFLVNRPNGYGEMGIYNAANQWYAMLLFIPSLLGQVVLPVLSERMGNKKVDQSLKAMIVAIKTNAVIVLPIAIIISVFSPQIMNLYGDNFRNGWPTLIAILLSTSLVAIQTPVGQIIMASGKMWIGFFMNIGWALVYISSTFFLIYKGSFGLASARLISYVFHSIWVFYFAYYLVFFKKSKISIGLCDNEY